MGILCAGQIVFDILVKPVNDESLTVDTTAVESILFSNGGDSLNVAVNCSHLGEDVSFCGKIGEDDQGRFMLDKMAGHGLRTDMISVDPLVPTSSVIVLIHDNGSRNFLYHGGANDSFTIDDIPEEAIENNEIIYVGGAFMLPKFDGHGAAELFRRSQERGKITAMDVSYDSTGRWMDIIRPSLPYLDYFLPSIGEAEKITKKDRVEDMADLLLEAGVKHVVIKLGKEGVYCKDHETEAYISPYDVEVVDTTGAGDSFVAGFLTGISKGKSLLESIDIGQAVSAQCIGSIGSTTKAVSYPLIEEFIENYKEERNG